MALITFCLYLLFLVASRLPHSHSLYAHDSCIETERIALLSIKEGMWRNDDNNNNNSQSFLSSWTGHDCCHWRGVSCNHETGHVTDLDLQYPYYYHLFDVHSMPPPSKLNSSLIQLHHLKHLDLSMNNFNYSPIPDFIGSLANLEYLNLSHAKFSGIIPHTLGNLSSLRYLDLSSNYFLLVNELHWLSGMTSLHHLDLSGVDLSNVHDWLHDINMLPSLLVLKLSYAQLQADAGGSHGTSLLHHLNFTSLRVLDLSYNNMNSTLPQWLFNLTRLVYLDLSSNNFIQTNDLHWLSGMTSLHHLDLSGVDLSNVHGWLHDINMLPSLLVLKLSDAQLQADAAGIHDTALFHHLNFTSLRVLDLSHNYGLNITLLQWVFNLNRLAHLDLSSCALYGKLPVSIGNLSSLRVLSLYENSFDGMIPESLGNLGGLERLYLSLNYLNGSIPESLNNLTNLVYFDLSNNKIGKLPKSMGEMQNLVGFDLFNNQVQGLIPASIGYLRNLQYLYLSRNMISGSIPETMGNLVRLQILDLSENAISGNLPESFGNLSQLWDLNMQGNDINGTVSKFLGKFCKLQYLDFTSNSISGGINDLVDGLSNCRENKEATLTEGLRTLRLGNNILNGTVPGNIGKLSKLIEVNLSSNSLMGVLTESHFANLVKLVSLDFSYNSLQLNVSENWKPPFDCRTIRMCSVKVGPVFPTWVKTQTQLGELCISDAGISGNIPAWLPTSFYNLNLSNNNLEGRLPTSFKNWAPSEVDLSSNRFEGPLPELDAANLVAINLNSNSFSGSIPSYFAVATGIQIFSFSNNHINGSIPSYFCSLTLLELFDVSNNEMSGGLPSCWDSTSALEIIDLSDNNFTGKIPDGLVSLSNLRSLYLRNNSFYGELPLSLRKANKLAILDIGENKLSGNIPTWIGENLSSLIVLRLRSNLFKGIIPQQLSKLFSLQILDLAHNNLSGCIPSSFGDFKAMVVTNHNESFSLLPILSISPVASPEESFSYSDSLPIIAKGVQRKYSKLLSLVTSIDLSNNKLSCELPQELTKLHGLHFLNLSYNLLNGKIPESISDMKQLESLDLSENSLFGTIPSGMSTLGFLSHLNLSHNNLSGRIPSGGQLQTFDPSVYSWNLDLCGSPLQDCANVTQYPQTANKEEGKGDWSEMLGPYIGLTMGFITGFWMIIGTIIIKQSIRIAFLRYIDKVSDFIYVKSVVYSRRLKSTFSRRK